MRKYETQIQLFLDKRLKDDFKKAVTIKSDNMASVLRRFIANYCNTVLTDHLKVHDGYNYIVD